LASILTSGFASTLTSGFASILTSGFASDFSGLASGLASGLTSGFSGLAAARCFSSSPIAFSTSLAGSPPVSAPWNDSWSLRSSRSSAASGSLAVWVSARSRWPRASTRLPTITPTTNTRPTITAPPKNR